MVLAQITKPPCVKNAIQAEAPRDFRSGTIAKYNLPYFTSVTNATSEILRAHVLQSDTSPL